MHKITIEVDTTQALKIFGLLAAFEDVAVTATSAGETGCCQAPVDTTKYVEVTTQEVPAQVDGRTQFEKLMDELNDPRYTLRTYSELRETLGYDFDSDIDNDLDSNRVEYVVKTRRSDGAALIGLTSRN